MYILKNAIKNLFRNKGRNIIVGIIILAMLTFTAISMIINTTTENVIKSYKEQFGSEIYLQYDDEKIKENQKNGNWQGVSELSDELKIKLADSEFLKETMISVTYQAFGEELKSVGERKPGGDSGGMVSGGNYQEPNLTVYGYNTSELLRDFKEGKRKITSGKMFENDGECVVSEDFAKLNNLQVGDEIKISSIDKDAKFDSLALKVAGIYFDSTKIISGDIAAVYNVRNDVLTNYETMRNYQENVAKTRLYEVSTTYFLKSPDMLEAFNKEAHGKGLDSIYKMATDVTNYNKIVKPAESLANVSSIFLIAVLIIGSVVLILLSVLSIRERKYEVGVLRAMGMKKMKVVRGILYESLITISLCLVIGLSIGAMVAQPVSDMITENQQEQSNNLGEVQVEQEEIKVSLTPKAVLDVSAIALLLALISSSVGVLYILRYEPMKILSERN